MADSAMGSATITFARAAGNVEHIGRPGKPAHTPPQSGHQALTLGQRNAEPSGAGGGIKLVQIIRLHAQGNHRPEKIFKSLHAVIHAAQQD